MTTVSAEPVEVSVDFARDIVPILRQQCFECHGPDEQNGGLRLDRPQVVYGRSESSMTDSGQPTIVAGDAEASELIARVTSDDEYERMPPDGEPMASADIEILRRWIRRGAPWPSPEKSDGLVDRERPDDDRSKHWSFQPIQPTDPPAVASSDWPRSPIDRFIAARRERRGLRVAPDASAITLIRRASYGLTGLPPTPAEVDAFVAKVNASTGLHLAFEELVNELLDRPSYGERWGRHWMDWVRYADTAGDNSDYPIPQAYRYRDYIIDSFNRDVPYNRFLTEQLAGDLLPADTLEQRNRQTIATGYLAMARRFGSLVETYPWHLTIEDTVDNIGKTMLGVTIACARCHDHKFDPISTRDYYGLYGIFASTRYPFPGIELFQAQHGMVPLVDEDQIQAVWGSAESRTSELEAELQEMLDQSRELDLANAEARRGATLAEQRAMDEELERLRLKVRKAGKKLAAHLKTLPPLPVAYAVQDADPADAAIQIKGEPNRLGATVPRKFPDVLGGFRLPDDVAESSSGRLQLAHWITSDSNPLTARVIVNRVWQRHFGTGLVSSTSDFGTRGSEPTHPRLLDWLADDFIQNGWSLKKLHRRILSSRTYQLSSLDVPSNLNEDPDNEAYWRFNRQRLDAESIRDTLLMIGGNLDTEPPMSPHPFPDPEDWSFTQHHPFKDVYPNNRRSVYQLTKRLTTESYMLTFDGPDPNVCTASRDQSVTALQALYFINDEFFHEQSRALAERLLASTDDPADRIRIALMTVLGRGADSDERSILLDHVDAVTERLRPSTPDDEILELAAWTSLARSLLRLNEFLYVD